MKPQQRFNGKERLHKKILKKKTCEKKLLCVLWRILNTQRFASTYTQLIVDMALTRPRSITTIQRTSPSASTPLYAYIPF